MTKSAILAAWGRIFRGRKPLLSIEITKECLLHCPGCYPYEPEVVNAGFVGVRALNPCYT
jgi:hypothetical protein